MSVRSRFAFRHIVVRISPIPYGGAGLAMLALMFQLIAPGFARASDLGWIEICSDLGAVWVQVDLDATPEQHDKPCPECKHCTLCQTATPLGIVFAGIALKPRLVTLTELLPDTQSVVSERRYQRPTNRGPPAVPPVESVHATRVSKVLTLIKGGAPSWT